MLTSEQVITILREVVLGQPCSVPGEEAAAHRAEVEAEVKSLKAQSFEIDIPYELPEAE